MWPLGLISWEGEKYLNIGKDTGHQLQVTHPPPDLELNIGRYSDSIARQYEVWSVLNNKSSSSAWNNFYGFYIL